MLSERGRASAQFLSWACPNGFICCRCELYAKAKSCCHFHLDLGLCFFSAGRLQTSEKHLSPSHVCCKGRNLKFRDLRNTWHSNSLYTLGPTGAVSFTKKRKEKEEDTKRLWSYLSCGYCCHSCTMQIYSCLASSSVSLVELSFTHCRTACQAVISFSICTQVVRHQIKPAIRVCCIVQRYSIGVR